MDEYERFVPNFKFAVYQIDFLLKIEMFIFAALSFDGRAANASN